MNSSSRRREIFLNEIGVGPLWTRRDGMPGEPEPETLPQNAAHQDLADIFDAVPAASIVPEAGTASATAPSAAEIAEMDWAQLKTAVAGCVKCGLCKSRTKTVFGTGDEKAKWLFIGEGPGRNEDLQGEPFIGPAGKLLDNMLLAMGLKRGENAYIANIVKCRPTDADGRDRAPTAEEAAACRPYLERQIALMQPAILIALGKTAGLSLLGIDQDTPVAQLRGKVHRHNELPLVVTYHPAYLLRKPVDKAKTWSDLCLAMDTYAGKRNQ
jgi:uracil-DNA glycosylase family 4